MEGITGELRSVAFNRVPQNWAFCEGQTLNITDYPSLYSLIGTTYGGNGVHTFNLPDLRGRVVVGAGQGVGLSDYPLGAKYGEETITLSTEQMPSHTHTAIFKPEPGISTTPAVAEAGNSDDPSGNVLAQPSTSAKIYSSEAADSNLKEGTVTVKGTVDVVNAGGSQPHDNRQPLLVLNWAICLDGQYPEFD